MKEIVFCYKSEEPPDSGLILAKIATLGYRSAAENLTVDTFLYHDTQDGRFLGKRLRLRRSSSTAPWEIETAEGSRKRNGTLVGTITRGKTLVPLLKAEVKRRLLRLEGPTNAGFTLCFETWVFTSPFKPDCRQERRIMRVMTARRADTTYLADLLVRYIPVIPVDFDVLLYGLSKLRLPLPGAPVVPKYSPQRHDSFLEAGKKTIGLQVYRMCANTEGALRDLDPEFLHDMRVATRRARFALKVFGELWEMTDRKTMRAELRWLAKSSAGVRDLDVFLAHINKEFDRVQAPEDIRSRIRGVLQNRRYVALDGLRKALRSERCSLLAANLERLATEFRKDLIDSDLQEPARIRGVIFIESALNRVCKWQKRKAKKLDHSDLHQLRIDFKRLRYTCEFFAGYYGRQMSRATKQLVGFQDCLGLHQDAWVAAEKMRSLMTELGEEPSIAGRLEALIQAQQRTAERQRKRFAGIWRSFSDTNERLRRELRAERGSS